MTLHRVSPIFLLMHSTRKLISLIALLALLAASATVPAADARSLQARPVTERISAPVRTFTCASATGISVEECEVLASLYNATGGVSWTNHSGWLDTLTPCNWYGITCSAGHVNAITLNANHLSGPIPKTLGSLASLRTLNLSNNALGGGIPPELGNLASLQYLYLSSDQLTGGLPTTLGKMTQLKEMVLSANQLTGSIPPDYQTLTALTYLNLVANQLSGSIPAHLLALTSLQDLELSNNQLTGGVPSWLGSITGMKYLYLGSNHLSGKISPELMNLTNLIALDFSGNGLTGSIPSGIGGLTSLRSLNLSYNAMEGEIPASLANLLNTTIDIRYNGLYTTNPALIAFLNLKAPGWLASQTVPPANLHAVQVTPNSAEMAWTPVLYTSDPGYYQLEVAFSPGGPYTIAGQTIAGGKLASSLVIAPLLANTTYYVCARTFTAAHGGQQNDLLSVCSTPVMVRTQAPWVFLPSVQK